MIKSAASLVLMVLMLFSCAEKKPDGAQPPPPREEQSLAGCPPSFCSTCRYNCQNQTCFNLCQYCWLGGFCN